MTALVTRPIASAVLWQFGAGQPDPGHFAKGLLQAIIHADETNTELLRVGFPGWVEAVHAARNETYGMNRLAEIAGVA